MSVSLGDAVLYLKGDNSDARRKLGETEGEARGFAGRVGGILNGALSFVGGSIITSGLGFITSGIQNLGKAMIEGNQEFEVYKVQFGVLLGSADAAAKRIDELSKFGAETPFDLPEIVRADKILQAFGFHAEDAQKKFGFSGEQIRTIAGDVAAGTKQPFESIASYLGKFASGSTGEAIMRLSELGVVTRKELADMGLKFSKSGELLSPLPEATEVLLKAMKGKFGGMMDAQSQTFDGMLSNFRDFMGNTARTLGAPVFDVLKKALSGLLQILGSDEAQARIKQFATLLASGIQAIITVAMQLANTVSQKGAGGILEMLGITPEASATAQNIAQSVISVIGTLVGWVAANIPLVASVIGQVVSDLQPLATALIAVLGQAWQWLSANLPPILETIKRVLGALWTRVEPIFKEIVSWLATQIPIAVQTFAKFFNETLLPAISDVVKFIEEKAIPFITTLWEWLKTNIPAAVDEVVKVFNTLLGIQKDVSDAINNFIKDRLQALLDAFNKVKDVVEKVVNFIKQFRDGIAGIDPSKILGGGAGSTPAAGANTGGTAGVQSVGGQVGAAFAAAVAQSGPKVAQLVIKGKVLAEAVFEDGADAARNNRRRSYAS